MKGKAKVVLEKMRKHDFKCFRVFIVWQLIRIQTCK